MLTIVTEPGLRLSGLTMNSEKTRVGFIGVGGMGQAAHLRNYVSLPDCEVVALAELRAKTGALVGARYGISKVYTDHSEMLEKEKLDAIVASQPFDRHGLLLPELAATGIPVFSEKPLAASIEQGERIAAAFAAAGNWLMVGYHKRSELASEYARKEIEKFRSSGELGKLRYLRLTMPAGDWIAGGFNDNLGGDDPYPSLPSDPPPSDLDETACREYREFVNYYIHQINLLRFFLGESYSLSYADPARVVLAGHSASGIPVTLEMSPYQTSLDWQESALIAFEKGYIRVDFPAPLAFNRPGRVEVFKDAADGPVTISPTLPWVHAMRNQASNFLAAVRGEKPAPCLAPEALEDLRIARDYIRLLRGV